MEHCRIIFCPESNLANEGVRITRDLRGARPHNVHVLREDTDGKEGVRMTDALKKEMWYEMRRALNEHRVRFHPLLVVAGCGTKTVQQMRADDNTPEGLRQMLIKQLKAYRRQLIYKKNDPGALPTEKFTGKIGGAADDHSIVAQLLFIAHSIYEKKRDFYQTQKAIYEEGESVAPPPVPAFSR